MLPPLLASESERALRYARGARVMPCHDDAVYAAAATPCHLLRVMLIGAIAAATRCLCCHTFCRLMSLRHVSPMLLFSDTLFSFFHMPIRLSAAAAYEMPPRRFDAYFLPRLSARFFDSLRYAATLDTLRYAAPCR